MDTMSKKLKQVRVAVEISGKPQQHYPWHFLTIWYRCCYVYLQFIIYDWTVLEIVLQCWKKCILTLSWRAKGALTMEFTHFRTGPLAKQPRNSEHRK
jgi:hypothetical protein